MGSQSWEFSVGKIRMRTKRIRMRTVWEHVKVDMKEPQTLSKVCGKPELRSLAYAGFFMGEGKSCGGNAM